MSPNANQAGGDDTAADADPQAFRVLIVEDDRSQALFAQSVLNGVGMRTLAVGSAADVVPALAEFAPDLVLMDLHLPDANGAELTARIREMPEHAHLPIVFLTGDTDPETEFQALELGADDFLSKPVRPRHLVAAVQSRVKRARSARGAAPATAPAGDDERDPATGLYRRNRILARLADAAGALMVEIQHMATLQQRLGYSGVETAIRAAATRIAEIAPDAARLNDTSFLVLADAGDRAALAALARQLRDAVARPLDLGETPLRLRAVVAHGAPADAGGDPLAALERTLREARVESAGVAALDPATVPVAADDPRAAELREALDRDGFELAFQPIAAVAGGDEAQFQVLLRLRDADGQLQSAGALVARAQSAGLLDAVDRWVLTRALGLLVPGQTAGQPPRLFVSQSPQAIAADPQGEWLRAELAGREIPPSQLVIEVRLEDAMMHAIAIGEFCERLAPLGVRFCLGQYVHGDETEPLLRRFPLSYVRLASRYSQVDADPRVREELRQLVQAAHAADLRVIGAQVENPSAAATLWMSGIDFIQGNLVQGVGGSLDFDFHHSVL